MTGILQRATTPAFLVDLVSVDGSTGGFLKDSDAGAAGLTLLSQTSLSSLFSGFLFGLTLSNNSTTAIDVTAGKCVDSTGAALMSFSALTNKILGTAWAAGSSAGMLDTGAVSNTTYHIFCIKKDSDASCDILASLSATAPTMPSGYTFFRRIGSIMRESGSIALFIQDGDVFIRKTPVQDIQATNPGTSVVTATLSVPTGIRVEAIFGVGASATIVATDSVGTFQVRDALETDSAPGVGVYSALASYQAQSESGAGNQRAFTNTSAQVVYRAQISTSGTKVRIHTHGWIDTRGRLA